jgi:arabinofuranosyltransferase
MLGVARHLRMMPPMEVSAKPGIDSRGVLVPLCLVAIALALGLSYGPCTQDDAFISFRYAENLVSGNGLVYNPGEYVEGFTNLSWTLLLAGVMSLGIEPVTASTLMGLMALVWLVLVTFRMANSLLSTGGAVLSTLLVSMDAQLALESVEGLETTMYAALVTMGIHAAVNRSSETRSSGWFSLAVLTRPDGLLAWGATHLFLWARDGRWRSRLRAGIYGSWPIILVVLVTTVARITYYGDPLPNTFYAKTGGWAVPRGLAYLWAHIVSHPVLWGLVLVGLTRAGRQIRSLGVIVSVVLAYVVWVGGDFKPTGRFIIPILPVLCVVAGAGFDSLFKGRQMIPVLAALGVILGVVRWDQWNQANEWAKERHANLESRRLVGDWIAMNSPKETVMAIHSAGAIPFYAGLKTIDMWGLTNREVARSDSPDMGVGLAGHERSAPEYVFSLQPDLYVPEDKVFTLKPWKLHPEPGVSKDFSAHYRPVNVKIQGRWLNMWVRKDGLMARLQGAEGAIEQ